MYNPEEGQSEEDQCITEEEDNLVYDKNDYFNVHHMKNSEERGEVDCCSPSIRSKLRSVTWMWKCLCHLLFGSYFLSAILICVLKLYDQFLPFSLYDDANILMFHTVAMLFLIKAFFFIDPEYYIFYKESYNLIRFCTCFSIVLELECLVYFMHNYYEVSFYLSQDPEATWKVFCITASGIFRLPVLSMFLYIQHRVHSHGKGHSGKHWLLLVADVAITQFYFLFIWQNGYNFLPTWFATLVAYTYHRSTKTLFLEY